MTRGPGYWAVQLLVLLIFWGSGFCVISTLVAKPRTVAMKELGIPIPGEHERVVINHLKYYPWPFGKWMGLVFGATLIASGGYLALSAMKRRGWASVIRRPT